MAVTPPGVEVELKALDIGEAEEVLEIEQEQKGEGGEEEE